MNLVEAEQPTYVYGLIKAETEIPDGLAGLGPSGRVSTVAFGRVAAIVSDVPTDRPLGVRGDLVAHEMVLDAVAARDAVVPMRFPAVVEEHAVVDELLAPNEEHFVTLLENLEGRSQFTLTGRYEQDAVLREVLEGDEEIRALREKVRELPEDASYYDRVRLGELIVERWSSAGRSRQVEGAGIIDRLERFAIATVANQLGAPEDVVNASFLVERERQEEFENAVEGVGEELAGRVRLRLLGPVAPYDFTPGGLVGGIGDRASRPATGAGSWRHMAGRAGLGAAKTDLDESAPTRRTVAEEHTTRRASVPSSSRSTRRGVAESSPRRSASRSRTSCCSV